MKLTKYFLPLAGIAMMVSCSNDKIMDPVPIGQEGDLIGMVEINLPTLSGSRAITDNDFDPGTGIENSLKNAKIYLFKVAENGGEDAYTYVTSSSLYYPEDGNGIDKDIEKTAKLTIKLPKDATNGIVKDENTEDEETYSFYGLAVVNLDDAGTSGATSNGFTEPVKDQTFGAWKATVLNASGSAKNGTNPFIASVNGEKCFTMTNAPRYEKVEANALVGVTTLVPVSLRKFVEAPAQPTASAATFTVQRGVAKVVIKGLTTTTDGSSSTVELAKIPSDISTSQYFKLENWALDVTNLKSYPVQNIANTSNTKTVFTEMAAAQSSNNDNSYFYTSISTNINFNHIWWAIDPNYQASATKADNDYRTDFFSYLKNYSSNLASGKDNEKDIYWAAEGNNANLIDYCLENTMPYDGMSHEQTTRVLFKGTYYLSESQTSAESFIVYVGSGNGSDIGNDKALSFKTLKLGADGLNLNVTDIEQYFNTSKVTGSGNYTLKEMFVEGADEPTEGERVSGTIYKADIQKLIDDISERLNMYRPGEGKVDYYKDGVTYYTAYIKHFDPESETRLPQNYTGLSSYTAAQTGRYGVLRNNAYYVSIRKVLGFGSPTVPDPDPSDGPDPDDDPEDKKYNILVDINVLAWAKRDYGYDLK